MKALNKTLMLLTLALAIAFIGGSVATAQGHGNGYMVRDFVDNDGDGFNDLAPDHDGDGIPNGQDEDYIRPQDGSGNKFGNGGNTRDDENMFQHWYRHMNKWLNGGQDGLGGGGQGKGYGPGDGTGNGGDGPRDGSGNGPGGDGDCDGDGPHGPGRP